MLQLQSSTVLRAGASTSNDTAPRWQPPSWVMSEPGNDIPQPRALVSASADDQADTQKGTQ
jgi:hypothetical protein